MKARLPIMFAALLTITVASTALAGRYGPPHGGPHWGPPAGPHGGHGDPCHCKVVYETRYRTQKVTKYKEETFTTYLEKKVKVPREITETLYKEIVDVVFRTVTDYRLEEVDKGEYREQSYIDACGCTKYKRVWFPKMVTIKVPYEREIKEFVTKKVPYQVTRTIYEEIVKKVPVTEKKLLPYVVEEKIPYKVATKLCQLRMPW